MGGVVMPVILHPGDRLHHRCADREPYQLMAECVDPLDAARESPAEPDWRRRERVARAARREGVVE